MPSLVSTEFGILTTSEGDAGSSRKSTTLQIISKSVSSDAMIEDEDTPPAQPLYNVLPAGVSNFLD